jgi:uncharacterized membrane protein YeaQ/YmgE (transglycosylase-associated protein family)
MLHLTATPLFAQFGTPGFGLNLISWLLLGLIAGFIASKLVNKSGEGIVLDIILGILGAVVGGWIFNQMGSAGVTGFNVWSIVVSVVGAIVVLLIWHAIRGNLGGRRR